MNAQLLELLARHAGPDPVSLGEMVKRADAVSSQMEGFLRSLESGARQQALDMIVQDVAGRLAADPGRQGKAPPELLSWARATFDEKEFVAGLREVEQTGGLELKDFFHDLTV